jgi:hypothetical protein
VGTAVVERSALHTAEQSLPDSKPSRLSQAINFDAATVLDRATHEDPQQAPVGMPHIIVNGTYAVRDGAYTGVRAGTVLRHVDVLRSPPGHLHTDGQMEYKVYTPVLRERVGWRERTRLPARQRSASPGYSVVNLRQQHNE